MLLVLSFTELLRRNAKCFELMIIEKVATAELELDSTRKRQRFTEYRTMWDPSSAVCTVLPNYIIFHLIELLIIIIHEDDLFGLKTR